ncbi:(Fe-S)-binding protein [Bacillus pseudomycoides]|uniref:Glycolate oxidase iron-sulfur subunit n=1 Tax=Bacillus pseudomycoides TaxID=64104 RepID=A0AAJ1YUX1_9BACI|nr:(Fe-S)-binding protein [Bacillus pseudomycoides]KFN13141.1 4Fe-4S dicluster domain protein [Bacillus pseudomycoides]MDR4186274.1 (Fe-S)-binding protein [Bacillus pseudomycoides]MDR4324878.1 (Fe-S)-binding protein [Bacillus pseudomycoides]MED0856961.1 (Fe-S)-binding protein [Bacillus pseudomycoides]MED1535087.1 (Fe-S)-binding protein [Bacillus pseudomycoides]
MTTLNKGQIQKAFKERLNEDELLNCMRCGFCLPTCPTYIQSGYKESHSPRGRIALMKGIVDGLIEPDEDIENTLNVCLGCRACEPVCPSGVNYGHLLEEARDIMNQNKKFSMPVKAVRKIVFEGLFPHQNRMRTLTGLIGFYQRSGLQTLTHKTGIMKLFPETLATMDLVLPKVPKMKEMKNRPEFLPAETTKKKRVAFFTGCLMDTMFLETNNATMKLLQLAGCDVVIPKEQSCCGALHGHAGEKSGAKELAKRNIQAFEDLKIDYIITNAGGCGAYLVDYDYLLKDDPKWAERAKQFVTKIKDITAILVELDFHKRTDLRLPPQIITYQDSCHLRNVMRTSSQPRMLLQAIQGVTYREMKEADRCCGSAGIYNIVHSELSMEFLDYKMERVHETDATTIVTANPGCLLQMKLGIEREKLSHKMRGIHIVDLLLEAIESNS